MSAENKAIVEKINAAFSRGDVEGFLAHCADDFTWRMVGGEVYKGKQAIREWMGKGPSEPPSFTVDALVAEGDVAICTGEMTMKENGSVVPYGYCDIWRFKGDRATELKVFAVKTGK